MLFVTDTKYLDTKLYMVVFFFLDFDACLFYQHKNLIYYLSVSYNTYFFACIAIIKNI